MNENKNKQSRNNIPRKLTALALAVLGVGITANKIDNMNTSENTANKTEYTDIDNEEKKAKLLDENGETVAELPDGSVVAILDEKENPEIAAVDDNGNIVTGTISDDNNLSRLNLNLNEYEFYTVTGNGQQVIDTLTGNKVIILPGEIVLGEKQSNDNKMNMSNMVNIIYIGEKGFIESSVEEERIIINR
jgi:hypothetical protein